MIVLASASPRRRELLEQIGVDYRVQAVDIDESARPGEAMEDLVLRVARDKARAAAALVGPGRPVLGADTLVAVAGVIMGKPADRDAAFDMLSRLSGREHEVMTAVALVQDGREAWRVNHSRVVFRELAPAEMEAYWATGEPQGKAGGYAIQGRAAMFVRRLEGSYSGVMGLPLFETAELLREFGVSPLQDRT